MALTDTFTDADNTVITSHTPEVGSWAANSASVGDPPKIIGNKIVGQDTDLTLHYIGDTEEWTTFIYHVKSKAGYAFVLLRSSTSAYTTYIVFHDVTANIWNVNRVDAGSGEPLAQYGESLTVGDVVKVDAQILTNGAQVEINLYVNDVLRIAAVDSTAGRITTTGKTGVGFVGMAATSTTGLHIGSFYSGTAAEADPDLDGGALPTVTDPLVIYEGDSQFVGTYNTLPTLITADLYLSPDVENVATAAETLEDILAQVPLQAAWDADNEDREVVVVVCGAGTNDIYLDDATGAQVYARYGAVADAYHALGANVKFMVWTITHRDWPGDGGAYPADDPDVNDRIDDANALIIADASGYFDAVVRLDAIFIDPATHTSDGVHWTQAFAELAAPAIAAKINPFLGYVSPSSGISRSRLINAGAG